MRRFSSHTVYSSSWSRRKQAEMLDEWQIMARTATNCGQIRATAFLTYSLEVQRF